MAQLADDLRELLERTEEIDELQGRCDRMAAQAGRIRRKADLATGIADLQDDSDRDLYGRGVGAEGAVDLLIAQVAQLREENLRLRLLTEVVPRVGKT